MGFYLFLLGLVFSGTETAAGGNYNLHFLSASARRGLSPAWAASQIHLPANVSTPVPRHAIVPYVPVSVYLPRAGFLWQDEAVWLRQLGVFGERWELDGPQNETLLALSRVYLSDPIGRRHPWAFEQDLDLGEFEPRQQDIITTYLWSGERVHLRSRISSEYLGVAGAERSLIDQEMGIPPSEDGFVRLRTG